MSLGRKVIIAIPQLSNGGAERVASIWANELVARSYEVTMLLFHRSFGEYALNPGVKCVALAEDIVEYREQTFITKYRHLRSLLRNLSPDYLISFLPSMQVWCMMTSWGLGIRRVDTIRVNPWKISVTNPLYRFMWKVSYATCEKIVVQATGQAQWFSKHCRRKISLIPNPMSYVYKNVYKESFPDYAKEFIAVGRIEPQKNYPMLIKGFAKAVKSHPDIYISIFGIGSDEYVSQLKSYVAELGMESHIFFKGRSEHLEHEYVKKDSFIMTSDFEGLPNALMEAMASRLVCISTDCKTGPRDLIEDGENGFLIPVEDHSALTDAICRVVEMSKESRKQIGDKARRKIVDYCSLERTIDQLCEVLK